MMQMKKMITPTIYSSIEYFVGALQKILNSQELNISINLIKFEDTRADVLIDDTIVGMIVSHYEDIKIQENVVLYFIPNIYFFKFVSRENIDYFIKLSNDFIKSYINVIRIDESIEHQPQHNQGVDKTFEDLDLDLTSENHRFFGNFMNNDITAIEQFRFIFSLINDNGSFYIIENFKCAMSSKGQSMLNLGRGLEVLMFKNNSMFSVSLEKNGDQYSMSHEHLQPLHSVSFSENSKTPDMSEFISTVFYYCIMKSKKMDLPNIEDFILHVDDYKKIIEMTSIR